MENKTKQNNRLTKPTYTTESRFDTKSRPFMLKLGVGHRSMPEMKISH